MKRYSVVDEWGQKVGEFIPEGEGIGNAIFFLLAILVLWTVGFLVYVVYKSTKEGFKFASQGEWKKATISWSVLGIPTFLLILAAVTSNVEMNAKIAQGQVIQDAYLRDVQLATDNLTSILTIRRIRGGLKNINGCNSSCEYFVFGEYEIKNNMEFLPLHFGYSQDCQEVYTQGITPIEAGQSKRVFCREKILKGLSDSRYWEEVSPCSEIDNFDHGGFWFQLCINPKNSEIKIGRSQWSNSQK